MSFSIVVALAALGLACVAALALWRPQELALGDTQPQRGRRRPAEPASAVRAVAGLVGFSPGTFKRTPGRGAARTRPVR